MYVVFLPSYATVERTWRKSMTKVVIFLHTWGVVRLKMLAALKKY